MDFLLRFILLFTLAVDVSGHAELPFETPSECRKGICRYFRQNKTTDTEIQLFLHRLTA